MIEAAQEASARKREVNLAGSVSSTAISDLGDGSSQLVGDFRPTGVRREKTPQRCFSPIGREWHETIELDASALLIVKPGTVVANDVAIDDPNAHTTIELGEIGNFPQRRSGTPKALDFGRAKMGFGIGGDDVTDVLAQGSKPTFSVIEIKKLSVRVLALHVLRIALRSSLKIHRAMRAA